MIQSIFFALLIICFTQSIYAQNLIPNADFEEYNELPQTTSEFLKVKNWFSPSVGVPQKGTPDFYHYEGGADALLPTPQWAKGMVIEAKAGKAIAGIIAMSTNNLHEYISVKLNTPLQKNEKYIFSFYCSNGQKKPLGAMGCRIGIGFSVNKPMQEFAKVINVEDYIQTEEIIYSKEWKKITIIYTAKDNFEYITIGNFDTDTMAFKKVADNFDFIFAGWAYYFIDGVEILPASPVIVPIITKEEEKILEKASYVQFKSAEAIILPASFAILDEVVALLKRYPMGMLSLEGHTDNIETADRNLTLSQARAESVKNYFVGKGILSERIQAKGFGLTQPKTTNDTPEGRSQNRRVEMKFKSK